MYYDLISSLPYLPHFTQADRLPITPLRLTERYRRLSPEHASQLERAQRLVGWRLVGWRSDRATGISDAQMIAASAELLASDLVPALRDFVAFRMDQLTILAALRRKQSGLDSPSISDRWGAGPTVPLIRRHWNDPELGLSHLFPWVPEINRRLASGNALGAEQAVMDVTWRWLDRCAERNTFSFEAAFSYVFKWDILRAWLACDADRAKVRFTELVDRVTHVEQN